MIAIDPLQPVDKIIAAAQTALDAGDDEKAGELFDAAIALETAIRATTSGGNVRNISHSNRSVWMPIHPDWEQTLAAMEPGWREKFINDNPELIRNNLDAFKTAECRDHFLEVVSQSPPLPEGWPDPAVDWLEPHYHVAIIATDWNWRRHLLADTVHSDMPAAIATTEILLAKFGDHELLTDLFGVDDQFPSDVEALVTYCACTPCGLNRNVSDDFYVRERRGMTTGGIEQNMMRSGGNPNTLSRERLG